MEGRELASWTLRCLFSLLHHPSANPTMFSSNRSQASLTALIPSSSSLSCGSSFSHQRSYRKEVLIAFYLSHQATWRLLRAEPQPGVLMTSKPSLHRVSHGPPPSRWAHNQSQISQDAVNQLHYHNLFRNPPSRNLSWGNNQVKGKDRGHGCPC